MHPFYAYIIVINYGQGLGRSHLSVVRRLVCLVGGEVMAV